MAVIQESEESIALRGFREPDQPDPDVIHSCVHCGLCLPSCPTYRVTQRERSSPRGRIWLMNQVNEGRLDLLDPTFTDEMSLCLNCRACEAVCPSGVSYGEILEASRAQIEANREPAPTERAVRKIVFGSVFTDMNRFRKLSGALRLYQRSPMPAIARRSGLLNLLGLEEAHELMPRVSDEFVVPHGETFPAEGEYRGRVGLFTGCIMSTAYAEVHKATIHVLIHNGFDVSLLKAQGCCGALHVHSGDPEGGRELARANIDAFERARLDAIIVNAAGCGAQMKEYGHLLKDDPQYAERAERFVELVKDATQFLAEVGLSRTPNPLPLRVTYQEPCHLAHAQRIAKQPRQLLKAIPELELIEMPESSLCCGSAGIYNLIQPDMSSQLLERKLDNAVSTRPDLIVSANPGCMLQLSSGLRQRGIDIPVVHLLSLLDSAYAAG